MAVDNEAERGTEDRMRREEQRSALGRSAHAMASNNEGRCDYRACIHGSLAAWVALPTLWPWITSRNGERRREDEAKGAEETGGGGAGRAPFPFPGVPRNIYMIPLGSFFPSK